MKSEPKSTELPNGKERANRTGVTDQSRAIVIFDVFRTYKCGVVKVLIAAETQVDAEDIADFLARPLSEGAHEMTVVKEVMDERHAQRKRWGAAHDRRHSWWDWKGMLQLRLNKVGPTHTGAQAKERRRALIELSAMCIAAIESNE